MKRNNKNPIYIPNQELYDRRFWVDNPQKAKEMNKEKNIQKKLAKNLKSKTSFTIAVGY